MDQLNIIINLPVIASYNLRSMMPKLQSLKTDILERNVDIALLQEIWEKVVFEDDLPQQGKPFETEKMFETLGLHYYSNPRPLTKKGYAYGGVAFIVNGMKFTSQKLEIKPPSGLEVIWGLAKSKTPVSKFKTIVICSFYSPPDKRKNAKLADHIVTTLHMLFAKYPESGLVLGADKNGMDISPILNCGLRLRQVVDKITRGRKTINIILMNMFSHYQSPIIAPPVQCDNPKRGVQSDHSVPVCYPHADPFTRLAQTYKVVEFRPLPQSNIMSFGQWITNESWSDISNVMSSTEKAMKLDDILMQKLDLHFPKKSIKLSSFDKPFITKELKTLDRRRSTEYQKHGKSTKYFALKKKFESLYKKEAGKYLEKSVNTLASSKPGQAFRILKKLGAHPEDCVDNNSLFTLPSHESENLSPEMSAEKIVQHFSSISQEYPPLTCAALPRSIQEKIKTPGKPPQFTEYEVLCKIKSSKKPNSGVASDIPKQLITEFAPELAVPMTQIINKIFESG